VQQFPKDRFSIFDDVQISLDGNKDLHESIRGKGSFEKIIGAAKYLEGVVPVSFLCTVSSANHHQISSVARIARELGAQPKVGRMCGFGLGNPAPLEDPSLLKMH